MSKKFKRKDAHKKKRLPSKYRKPKGITNKMRLNRKGHKSKVRPGFEKDSKEKGKHKSGLEIITITNKDQLKAVDEKLKITILNLKVKEYKENAKKLLANKKKEKEERQAKEAKKKEEAKEVEKKKADEEKKEEKEEVAAEDKKKQEQKEMEKIITK